MKESVTHIIHNAWKVDFNLSLRSFESHIAGLRKLVDWCSTLDHTVEILYTSSVAAARQWNPVQGPVPEAPLMDPSLAPQSGYGASKFVSEIVSLFVIVLYMADLCCRSWRTLPTWAGRLQRSGSDKYVDLLQQALGIQPSGSLFLSSRACPSGLYLT